MDAGLVSQLDVFRAQQLVTQAEIQLFDAQGAIEDARDQLSFLLGRESESAFDVVPEIRKDVEPVVAEDAVTIALEKRLDLQGALADAADAERAAAYARNQLLPQFDVNLALTRRQTAPSLGTSFGLDGFQFATFFTISMPVDRTPQAVDYQNALIDRDRRRREIDTLRKRITDDVKRAIRNRDRVLRTLAAAEVGVQIGEREVEVAQLRYERGLSNNLDVVSAETSLLNAESRRILALAESAISRLSLRATLGNLDPQRDLAEPTP
jgi:outer membrane protein TolC